jgi:hypothetical protein
MSTLKVDTLQNSVGENLVFGNKNLLINGSQSVWQRATTASVSTDTYSTVDRFKTRVNSMGAFTISRSTDVPSGQGFGYSTKWDCTTADASPAAGDYILFQQAIEGQNLQHILKGDSSNAKKLTLSFWIKSNKTGTYIVELYDVDNTRQISKSYTISSASTWEKKEITFDGDTTGTLDNDNASSLLMVWHFGAGSTFSSGTLNTSWASSVNANRAVGQVNLADSTSNELYITGIQLEVGSKATDFEFEPFETTLRKCQRYYFKLERDEAATPTVQPYNHATYVGPVGQYGSATNAVVGIYLPTPQRAQSTVSYNRVDCVTVDNGTSRTSTNAFSYGDGNGLFPTLIFTTSSTSAGSTARVFFRADGDKVEFDSEL